MARYWPYFLCIWKQVLWNWTSLDAWMKLLDNVHGLLAAEGVEVYWCRRLGLFDSCDAQRKHRPSDNDHRKSRVYFKRETTHELIIKIQNWCLSYLLQQSLTEPIRGTFSFACCAILLLVALFANPTGFFRFWACKFSDLKSDPKKFKLSTGKRLNLIWVFPKIGVPQNGWLKMENPIKMDDLGVPLFSETPICFFLPENTRNHVWNDPKSHCCIGDDWRYVN